MKIGCDPEFLPIMSIKKLKITDPYMIAKAGGIDVDQIHDDMSYGYDKDTPHGNIGSDGGRNSDDIGELRPKAGSPKQVVSRLRKMIKHLQRKKIIADLIAGGGSEYKEALGGHIHIDIKLKIRESNIPSWHDISLNRLPLDQRNLIKALDHYIGEPLKNKKGGQRAGNHYGRLSDIRKADHGRTEGLEYRTAPSWLTSPELAEAVLWTAWAISRCYENDNAFWTTHAVTITPNSKFKVKDLELLKPMCKARGKQMIDTYGKIIKDKKFNLCQKKSITNWTGKEVII